MKVSIGIPSYRAGERLYYNLLYLNMQEYPRTDFEVIIVDNGSEDGTSEMLSSIDTNYELNSIHINTNMGRAFARNYGVMEAKGDIIVFLDSDMIAEKTFIAKHVDTHKYRNVAVCGQSWQRVYTYYYEDFKGYLRRNLYHQLTEYNFAKINKFHNKQPLISEAKVISGGCFEASFSLSKMHQAEKAILDKYGNNLDGYYFPWSLLVTNNCSIEKDIFFSVGGFDNSFIGWGCEDLDFGYRLYKNGCKFIKQIDISSVHQEHPINFIDKGEDNIIYFTKKYESIDLLLFYYGYLISVDKATANTIMTEIEEINTIKYGYMLEIYRRLLISLRNKNIRVDGFERNWFYEIKKLKIDIISYKQILETFFNSEESKSVSNFIISFNLLIKKVLNNNFQQLN
jgi:GT2 family glycosyltransferase